MSIQPVTEAIDQLVERVVETINPLIIILFGSAARGELGADSDIDLLVFMPGWEIVQIQAAHRIKVQVPARRGL